MLHSIFAAAKFKRWVKAGLKNNYRYYRPVYSLFATVSLAVVVWYHFSVTQQLLWNNSAAEKIIAVILAVPALIIMGISAKKYFMCLSGIDVLINRPARPLRLEQTGLHKYVRHPLYFGTLLFVWSVFLWQPGAGNLISCSCITAYTIIGTYFEEKKLVVEFGEEYRLYARSVPMLVPGMR
jgi:protein-S-isoprenylcysteine O-methyltransferase Ste14